MPAAPTAASHSAEPWPLGHAAPPEGPFLR